MIWNYLVKLKEEEEEKNCFHHFLKFSKPIYFNILPACRTAVNIVGILQAYHPLL